RKWRPFWKEENFEKTESDSVGGISADTKENATACGSRKAPNKNPAVYSASNVGANLSKEWFYICNLLL
ncbi:hypothetical protein AVEN_262285-1, partial [Araneus ventricosus]